MLLRLGPDRFSLMLCECTELHVLIGFHLILREVTKLTFCLRKPPFELSRILEDGWLHVHGKRQESPLMIASF